MTTVIDGIEQRAIRKRPRFSAGDRVKVHFQVTEGTRSRTQVFEGIVIKRQGSGARETFTVRKHSFGVGVERTFPLHSPKIEELEIAARGDVNRAKLYYLREKVGKSSRVAERRWGIEDELVLADEGAEALDSEGVAQSEIDAEVTEPEAEGAAEGETEGAEAEAEGEAQQAETSEGDQQGGDDAASGEEPEAEAPAAAEGESEKEPS